MEKETLVQVLRNELRVNDALRHRMGIQSAVESVASEENGPLEAVVFVDKDGRHWALAVLEETE